MICWKGQCKYCTDENKCTVDDKLCDRNENHCRQDKNKELCQSNPDTAFCPDVPSDFQLLPFWSCENICRYYDNCEEK